MHIQMVSSDVDMALMMIQRFNQDKDVVKYSTNKYPHTVPYEHIFFFVFIYICYHI